MTQGLDGGKQFVGISHPQHPCSPNGGVIDVVEPVVRLMAAALEHQDGFVAGCGAGGREKMAGVLQLVHVEQDGAGHAVARELIQQLAEVDVAVIAKGDEGREAKFMLLGPIGMVVLTAADWERKAT